MKVNLRLLIILTCIGIGIFGGLFLLHAIQMGRHDTGFLERARTDIENEDIVSIGSALRHYIIYLNRHPDETEVRAEYGIALKENDHPKKALEQLERVVRDAPDHKEALNALADIMMYRLGRLSDARKHLKTLVDLDPTNMEYRKQLARCLIFENNYTEAKDLLEAILKEDPTQLECYRILSELYDSKLEAREKSREVIDRMVAENPESAEAYRIRAIYFYTHKQKEPLEKDIEKALRLAPKDKAILLLASNIAKSKGNLDAAKQYSMELIEAEPRSQEGYLQMATIEKENANLEKSLQWIEKGIKTTGGTQQLLFHKIDYLYDLHRLPKAEQELKRLYNVPFNSFLLTYLKARKSFANKNWATAKDQFETIRQNMERTKSFRFLIPRIDQFTAECYRQLGNPEKGKELVNRLQQSNTSTLSHDPLKEGQALVQEGKIAQAIHRFQKLAEHESFAFDARIKLFPLLLQRTLAQKATARDWSEVDQALDELNQLAPNDPQIVLFNVRTILAKDENHTAEAVAILDKAIQQAKTHTVEWDHLIEALKTTTDTEAAVQLLTQALDTWAKSNKSITQSIRLLERGNRDGALKILEFAKKIHVDAKRLWLTRIAIAISQKDWDRAEETVFQAIREAGDSLLFRKPLATIIVQRGGDDAAARLETVLQDIGKLPEDEQQELWKFVAVLSNRLGQQDRAIELCEAVAHKNPNDLSSHRTLFMLALEAEKKEVVNKTLQQIGRIDQKGPVWNYLSALKIAYPLFNKKDLTDEDQNLLETAVDHLNAAEVQRPNWGQAALLLGKVYDKLGNTKAAMSHLSQAVEFGERDSAGLARLAELYLKEHRELEAQAMLNLMRRSSVGLKPAGLVAMAKLKFRQGDKRGAMAELMAAVELLRKQVKSSHDTKTFLELAQALGNTAALSRQIGRPKLAESLVKEAKEAIGKASEVAPTDPRPWLILAALYKEQGDNQKIEEVITAIKNNVPEDLRQITLVHCYQSLGRTVEAELACEEALKVASKENDIAKQVVSFYLRSEQDRKNNFKHAENMLNKIIQGELPVGKEDLLWTRRRLALLLFQHGLQKNRIEAMKLIRQNLDADPDSLLDLRVQTRGLALKGTRKDKQHAIKILENLLKRTNPSDSDRFQLAKLYWNTDNWNGTLQQMQILLGRPNLTPEWYEFYVQCLTERGELSSARINLEKLKSMRPDTVTTTKLEASIHAKMGQPEKAIADLETFLQNPKSIPDNALVKLHLIAKVAEQLEALSRNQKNEANQKARQQYLDFAEKCYRDLAGKYEKNEMSLASFLGRHGKRDEAISLAEKAWKTNQPQVIAAATVRLLNTGNATPKQTKRVEKILDAATEHFGDRTALDLARAELRSLQKRYDETEKIYREVLKNDKENVVALNNLAVFLALRNTKLDDAIQSINKAIEIAGPQSTLLDSRASVYFARGELQKALDDIDAALQERPSAVRLFHQTQIQMATGDKKGAKRSLDKAMSMGLRADQLQPLERPSYRALRESLR